jgi:hypothetical protein
LNRKFANPAKDCPRTPLHGAIHFYKDVLEEVRVLAMNLKDMNRLTTAYRGGKFDLWEILHLNCPKLSKLLIVIDGPIQDKVTDKIEFRRLHRLLDMKHDDFPQRQTQLLQVLASRFAANKKGLWKQLIVDLVSIDQMKQLPMKDGEKWDKDGEGGFYDASWLR